MSKKDNDLLQHNIQANEDAMEVRSSGYLAFEISDYIYHEQLDELAGTLCGYLDESRKHYLNATSVDFTWWQNAYVDFSLQFASAINNLTVNGKDTSALIERATVSYEDMRDPCSLRPDEQLDADAVSEYHAATLNKKEVFLQVARELDQRSTHNGPDMLLLAAEEFARSVNFLRLASRNAVDIMDFSELEGKQLSVHDGKSGATRGDAPRATSPKNGRPSPK